MSFNFLKAENQLLEKSLQIPPPNFFRNQFLDTIARNQFLLKKINRSKQATIMRITHMSHVQSLM
jgi:hypothetical protein